MLPRRLVASFTLSIALVASGVLAAPPATRAADSDVSHTATSVYRLDPAKGRIKVTVDIVVTNRIPNTVEYVPCVEYTWDPYWGYTPYSSTCPQTTRYFVNTSATWVESEATNIKVSAGGASVSVKKGAKGKYYRQLDFTFARIWKGQTRRIRLTYTIPGGKPRSDSLTRAMRAYANFCATAHGLDGGRVEIRVPAAFTTDTTGAKLVSKVAGKEKVYSSGLIHDPAAWYACLEGSNEGGYKTTEVAVPGGEPVVLKAWPEDPAWATAVGTSVSSGLDDLSRLVGREMRSTGPLVVKESITGAEYAGWYDEESNEITVDEDFSQAGLVEHELAHVWFNGALFEDTWLSEGHAEWAARTVTDEEPCRQPSGASGKLSEWAYLSPKATDAERAIVDYQYDASCWVVTKIAAAVGDSRMTTALSALLDGADPYAMPETTDPGAKGSTRPAAARAASWKRWLDVVDELAVDPAGGPPTLASDLLVQFGVTADRAALDRRAEARTAFHELDEAVAWALPAAVRSPMTAWDFSRAQAALDAALAAWTVTGETDKVLAGVDARNGPAAQAWGAAKTASDLEAAAAVARRQLEAAVDMAEAKVLAEAPRDVWQQVGLIGSTVPSIEPGVAAVKAVEVGTAAAVAASIRQSLVDATSAGQLRIGVAIATVALLVLLLVFLLWRRSRRLRSFRLAAETAGAASLAETRLAALADTPVTTVLASSGEVHGVDVVQHPAEGDMRIAAAPRSSTDWGSDEGI